MKSEAPAGRIPRHVYLLLFITAGYLLVEFAFNARLLDVAGLALDPAAIHGAEQSGRLISGFALSLAVWGTLILPKIEKKIGWRPGAYLPAMAISAAVIMPIVYNRQKALIDYLVDRSTGAERHNALYATFLRQALIEGTARLTGFGDTQQPFSSADGKAFAALCPFLASDVSELSAKVGSRLRPILQRDAERQGSLSDAYNRMYLPSARKVVTAYANYANGVNHLYQTLAEIPQKQASAWNDYCNQLRSRSMYPGSIDPRAFNAIRRAVQAKVPVRNDWNPNDATTFYAAVASSIRSAANQAFSDAVSRELGPGARLPQDLVTQDLFVQNAAIQSYWHKALGIPEDGPPLRLNLTAQEFNRMVYEPLIDRQTARYLANFNGSDATFANRGKFEKTGRKAYEGLIVPPIALCFSLAGAILHVCKLLFFSLKTTPLRNRSFALGGGPSPLTVPIVVLTGLAITVAIAVSPCPVTATPLYRNRIYPDVSDQNGPEIAGIMTWVIKAERYGYPLNEWIRHDVLFNYEFPPLFPVQATPGGGALFAEDASAAPPPPQAPPLSEEPSSAEAPNPAPSGPQITAVSKVTDYQMQHLVIKGRGFGHLDPFIGDCPVFQFKDLTQRWNAGNNRGLIGGGDWITVQVTKWDDDEIDLGGFHGYYNTIPRFRLYDGDRVEVDVWNGSTGEDRDAPYSSAQLTVGGEPFRK